LSTQLNEVQLDLSFGVEAYADSVLIPELIVDSFQSSMRDMVGLDTGLANTSRMIERLGAVIGARAAVLDAAMQDQAERRDRLFNGLLAAVSLLALPPGLLLAFFGVNATNVDDSKSILDLGQYWVVYVLAWLPFASLLLVGFWLRRRIRTGSPNLSGFTDRDGLAVVKVELPTQRAGDATARAVVAQERPPLTLRPAISAHRGGTEQHPAATAEAYDLALGTGAEYVEFDIRKLNDGTLVCYHDPRADHNGPLLAGLSYRELCATVGYEVPTVRSVMTQIAGKGIGHLDLKEIGYEDEVIRLALQTLGEDNFVATTLEDVSVLAITRSFPTVRTALSLGRDGADIGRLRRPAVRLSELFPLRRIRACGAQWVAVDKTLARYGVLRQCARNGIGAMVWTVDDDPLIDRFLQDQRVDVLITNRPSFAVRRRATLHAAGAQSVPASGPTVVVPGAAEADPH
jgi:glycerophosphoryl diester phosphodiesterase